MFTGIINGLGTVSHIRPAGEGLVFHIKPDFALENPQEGESVSVNGVCLTATAFSDGGFAVDVSPETISKSTLGDIKAGTRVNLERALRLSDRLGGHLVSGHVDCMGEITEKKNLNQFTLFTVSIPKKIERYIIEKGSVAVDGISLTVNTCKGGRFSLAIIPHTLKITNLGLLRRGDRVNIEVDQVGKYIEKLLFTRRTESTGRTSIDIDMLARNGFL